MAEGYRCGVYLDDVEIPVELNDASLTVVPLPAGGWLLAAGVVAAVPWVRARRSRNT